MRILRLPRLIFTLCCALVLAPSAVIAAERIPALVPISELLPADQRAAFADRASKFTARLVPFQADVARFNALTADKQSDREYDTLMTRKAEFIQAARAFNNDELKAEAPLVIAAMNTQAKSLGWDEAEQKRLQDGLKLLKGDGDPSATLTQVTQVWDAMLARDSAALAQAAASGNGPGFPGAGTQTEFEDCAVFALANAAGLPYSVAAARAAKLIAEGRWRSAADRANPQKAIEDRGLIGGEVLMLAEAFGEAEVVPSTGFASTLSAGRRIMVNVLPSGGSGAHEVVLTKTFQHGGEPWFELMDSNQGPVRRLYLSAKELGTILQERGVAFRPDAKTTAPLLR